MLVDLGGEGVRKQEIVPADADEPGSVQQGPQTSNVAASKDAFDACATRSPGPIGIVPGRQAAYCTTSRWAIITPFGRPVLPLV